MEIRSYQIKRSNNDGKRNSIMNDLEKRIWAKAQTIKGGEWQAWYESLTAAERSAWASAKSKIGDPRDNKRSK